jgi:hypothetical protein
MPGGQRFDNGIAGRNLRLAGAAFAAQDQPADDGDVFQRRDLVTALRAGRSRHHQVVALRVRLRFVALAGAHAVDFALHHDGQAMDHHVEETANQQAQDAGHHGGGQRCRRREQHQGFLHSCFIPPNRV